MSAQPKYRISEQEYLASERIADIKHEYFAGDVYAMTGASRNHNIIVAVVIARLYSQLETRKCTVYPSDLRVKMARQHSYVYPDVSVVCGEEWFEDSHNDTLINPTVIIEVLSPSTEMFDRGKKFEQYRQIPSLREYILIAQDRMVVEQFVRQSQHEWLLIVHSGADAILKLGSIECELRLADIYLKVELAPVEPDEALD